MNFFREVMTAGMIMLITTIAVAQTDMLLQPGGTTITMPQSGVVSWWEMLLRQAPALTILAFIVITFLKHLDKRDEKIEKQHAQCHNIQTEAIASLRDVSQALGQHTLQTQRLERMIERVEKIEDKWRAPSSVEY